MLVIMETRCNPSKLAKSVNTMDFDGIVVANNEGYARGIMVAWNKKSLKVEMLDISFQHINMKAMFQEGIKWHFTTVYASPNEDKRRVLQEDLKKITDRINGAWMIVGDFNDISSSVGKKGGAQVSIRRCKTFRERINNYKLIDINMIDPKFIWCGPIYHGCQRIYKRLDKALCNDD